MKDAELKAAVTAKRDAAREDHARTVLGWDQVLEAVNLAAGRGLSQAVLTPPAGVNLKAAPSAVATVERLTAAGFAATWQGRRATPEAEEGFALVVSW